MPFVCETCGKELSTRSTLNTHRAKAQYCLAIRTESPTVSYPCTGCSNNYTSKYNLELHMNKCVQYNTNQYANRIVDLKQTIAEQKEHVAIKAATKSTTTTNNKNRFNYIQNMQPITDQHLADNLPYLTVEHVKKGAEGYAQYALEYPLKDRVACVDYSRRKVKYKDHDGNVITDPDMSNLTQKFFKSISERNKDLFKECAREFREKCDADSFDKMALLAETLTGVNESAGGSSSDFSHEFVKEVCKATVPE
jgi:hypothetical protein